MDTRYNPLLSSTRRFPSGLTNDQWQDYFKELRAGVEPSSETNMNSIKHTIKLIKRGAMHDHLDDPEDKTICYCNFINDILRTIRSGRKDYCYYVYQIIDLLKYEYDRLCTEYIQEDQCFKVWLSK